MNTGTTNPSTQEDRKVRVVSLNVLEQMCSYASASTSRSHETFWIFSVSRSRITVGYSNPDEYGNVNPYYAILPCYPSIWGERDRDNPRVVLQILRIQDNNDEYAYRPFVDDLFETHVHRLAEDRWIPMHRCLLPEGHHGYEHSLRSVDRERYIAQFPDRPDKPDCDKFLIPEVYRNQQ